MEGKTVLLFVSILTFTQTCAFSKPETDHHHRYHHHHHHHHLHKTHSIDRVKFQAVWNVPRGDCESKFGVSLNLDSYAILSNSADTIWNGDVITIFYNDDLGLYPVYESDGKGGSGIRKINAGLPQLTNLTQHYEKATNDIIAAIPNPQYSGLAVIDWEKWFPQWDFKSSIMNFYRGPSIDLVRERHPEWDNVTVELVAKLEFEQAAKSLMEGTLLLGQRLRPNGIWGFYHYPYCYNRLDVASEGCRDWVKSTNDRAPWLYRQTTAFYPSIYVRADHANVTGFVQARLAEALRIREAYGDPTRQPMYSYCRFNYSDTSLHYTLNDLNSTILQSAEAGLDGVVIWGDHNDTRSLQSCKQLQAYIASALGPVVKQTSEAAANCSRRLCSDHGRCVGKILECEKRVRHSKIGRKSTMLQKQPNEHKSHLHHDSDLVTNEINTWQGGKFKVPVEACSCLCYNEWSGDACNVPG